jgi:hypothetical protein
MIGVGETYDFEFASAAAGDLRIEVVNTRLGTVMTTMQVHVVR